MGICRSSLTEEQKTALLESRRLDRVLKQQSNQDEFIIKLLLLGTGESGKTTIFKQMQILHDGGFSPSERRKYKQVLRRNLVECMQTLVRGMRKLPSARSKARRGRFSDMKTDDEKLSSSETEPLSTAVGSKANQTHDFLLNLDPLRGDVTEFFTEDIVKACKEVWEDSVTKKFLTKNRSKLQLLDSIDYLIANIDRIGATNFTPNDEDILRARLRTTGIVERTFLIEKITFKFLDVGGQRNERRKWIHCFSNVTSVIFISAISEYDQSLWEDARCNRMKESIRVFDKIINNDNFKKTSMILFLNKVDIFQEKIRRVPLTVCFPEFKANHNQSEPEYADDAALYIESRFRAVQKSDKQLLFAHFTTATSTTNVKKVFDACQITILNENLTVLGLA